MITLTIIEARALALAAQRLYPTPSGGGREAIRQIIEHLGYVQIDTISVIRRAHHHVLWSRASEYAPEQLRQLEEEDRAVFEYWAHAASYLPMRDYRFSLPRKDDFLHGDAFWFDKDHKTTAYLLDRIRAEGPLMSKDFQAPEKKKNPSNGMDWSRNPVNLALRQLFMEGRIMVTGRRGFQKVYDLPERVLPADVDTRPPTREEYLHYLIERDVRALGLVKATEIGYLITNTTKEVNAILRRMIDSGELTEVTIAGLENGPYVCNPAALEAIPASMPVEKMHILSPFDNLVIQRKRLEALFGFSYTLECYVPAPKRKFGYFALPLLLGDRFIGQIDLKTDRESGRLLIQNLGWESVLDNPDKAAFLLAKSLREFARFNDCSEVEFSPTVKEEQGDSALAYHLNR